MGGGFEVKEKVFREAFLRGSILIDEAVCSTALENAWEYLARVGVNGFVPIQVQIKINFKFIFHGSLLSVFKLERHPYLLQAEKKTVVWLYYSDRFRGVN